MQSITMGTLLVYVLIVFRILGCFLLLPFFGNNMALLFKGALSVMLAFLVFPAVGLGLPAPALDLTYALFAALEVLTGLMMGFIVQLSFTIVSVAGEMASQEMGFRMSRQVDPVTGNEVPAIGQFYNLFAMLLFIGLNGHYWIVEILCRSFQKIPLCSLRIESAFGEWLVNLFTRFFEMGIQLAAPLFLLMLMITVGIGILAKLVEGINVFDIGFPIRIGVGLLFLMLFIPYLAPTLHRVYDALQQGLLGLLTVV